MVADRTNNITKSKMLNASCVLDALDSDMHLHRPPFPFLDWLFSRRAMANVSAKS